MGWCILTERSETIVAGFQRAKFHWAVGMLQPWVSSSSKMSPPIFQGIDFFERLRFLARSFSTILAENVMYNIVTCFPGPLCYLWVGVKWFALWPWTGNRGRWPEHSRGTWKTTRAKQSECERRFADSTMIQSKLFTAWRKVCNMASCGALNWSFNPEENIHGSKKRSFRNL